LILQWDNILFQGTNKSIILLDVDNQLVIDMKVINNYQYNFQEVKNFAIYYGDNAYIEQHLIPQKIQLGRIYPNPFNDILNIEFNLSGEKNYQVKIQVFNIYGEIVKSIDNSDLETGFHTIRWDGKNGFNQQLVSGIYMLRLLVNGKTNKGMQSRIMFK